MSRVIYLASDNPIEEYKNPHDILLSVNEALAAGVTDIYDFLLGEDFDKDRPGVLLVSDREVNINIDTGEVSDGEYDNDFSVFPIKKWDDMLTEKKFCALFEWPRYLPGRAQEFIKYLKKHLNTAKEIELWSQWVGIGGPEDADKRTISVNDIQPEDILSLENQGSSGRNICYTIINEKYEQQH